MTITVRCTDRGQHGEITLGDLTWSHGMLRANVGNAYGEIGARRNGECVWLDWIDKTKADYHINLRCPRCKRHSQLSYARAVMLRDGLADDATRGMSALDISRLP